MTDDLVTRRR